MNMELVLLTYHVWSVSLIWLGWIGYALEWWL